MSEIALGSNQYGKAENRVVRIYRGAGTGSPARHEIRDLTVSTCLRGDFAAAHTAGDQSSVLPTDTQKQTAYAFAKTHGDGSVADYALALARHFVETVAPVREARVEVDEHSWQRVLVNGREHDHTWTRTGPEVRTVAVTVTDEGTWMVGGVRDLVILKSTGSEFAGFLTDPYTVLEPAHDRMLATSLNAQWRFADAPQDWEATYAGIRQTMVARFADLHSLALQQTLFEMGKAVLTEFESVAEIRLSAPNKHHFEYDLERFGIANAGEVFYAADRPYGLIQASVLRTDAPVPGPAWDGFWRS